MVSDDIISSIEDSNKLLFTIIDLVPHLIFSRDENGRHLLVNNAFAKMHGLHPKDIIGKTLDELNIFSKDDNCRILKDDSFIINTGKSIKIDEHILTTSKGDKTVREVLKIPFEYCSKTRGCIKAVLGISIDITDRKRSENILEAKYTQLFNTLRETVKSLSSAVKFVDRYTYGHQKNVMVIAGLIAKQLDLSEDEINGIKTAALLHDIGKLSVPRELLTKPDKLRKEEFELIKYHAFAGYEITKNISFCQPIARYIYQHHERLDGSGYPNKLKGDEILLGSQILAVADSFEAMVTHRPYRPARGVEFAFNELEKNKGKLYNPSIVEILYEIIKGNPKLFDTFSLTYTFDFK